MTEYESVKKGVVKRTERRVLGVFIDGVSLDRATRRLNRKIDFAKLVKGVSSGLEPTVVRYYTIIPNEDDARQLSFLDAVHKSGLEIVVKRLPPKTSTKQVTIEIEMAADIVAFAAGISSFVPDTQYLPEEYHNVLKSLTANYTSKELAKHPEVSEPDVSAQNQKRLITIICPSREMIYPITLAKELGAESTTADFAASGDILKAAANWIDLSTSETIWKE